MKKIECPIMFGLFCMFVLVPIAVLIKIIEHITKDKRTD
jgi:hypothetical protein